MNTSRCPSDSDPSSGTASTISDVTRWKPRGAPAARFRAGSTRRAFWRDRHSGHRVAPDPGLVFRPRRSMDPPLRERLRWRNATGDAVEAPATRAAMARAAALFSAAGAPSASLGASCRATRSSTTACCWAAAVAALLGRRSCWSPTTASRPWPSTRGRDRHRGRDRAALRLGLRVRLRAAALRLGHAVRLLLLQPRRRPRPPRADGGRYALALGSRTRPRTRSTAGWPRWSRCS